MLITLTVNGEKREVETNPDTRLLELIREELNLTGAKEGCGQGECGACTVIMNGKLVASCLVLALQADEAEIITIEGLSDGDDLHPIQEAFIETGGIQCGFCTPGMVLASKILLDENKNPTEEEIRRALSGNLCRCTGYEKIIEAVKLSADRIYGERGEADE